MSINLVKDTKVLKLPRASGNVRSMLRRAEALAREQGWTKIIVIGQGPKEGTTLNSKMNRSTLLGLIEDSKHACLHD
jgi:hypothetical protein